MKQQHGLQKGWPLFGLQVPERGFLDLDAAFKRKASIICEIGFGMGQSFLQLAKDNPDNNYLGIEVHQPGVGGLLTDVLSNGLHNVRVILEDATKVLNCAIPDQALSELLLYFPDPWPKNRHHKRRLVQPDFVQLVSQKLRPKGRWRLATDWKDYAQHMSKVIEGSGFFTNLSRLNQQGSDKANRLETKFELRGKRLGHEIWDFEFENRLNPTSS
ncbi:MAG TPA: tRNA (guanosine(46)-N7)-methyltransferase TrmB [Gammaproteobacteria bacterium]|nr:tRNA (guanosine(46)-N7)-methyltransferase TrmB [Gammaproteobacteria bacterium]